jgi:TonB family protein
MTIRIIMLVHIAPVLCLALLTGPVHGQRPLRRGAVEIKIRADSVTGQDRSFLMLRAEGAGRAEEGAVLWACGGQAGGLSAGVRLEALGDDGARRPVAFQFGEEAPDTLLLQGENDSALWYLSDEDVAEVTGRLLSAPAFTVQVLRDSGPGSGRSYRYTPAGLDSALHRLGCPAAPALPRTSAGRETLRGVPQNTAGGEELPQPTNHAAFSRLLARNYPPDLRDAGVRGEVMVRFRVLQDGSVDSASVQVTRTTNPAFNDAAVTSVRALRFRPARVYGRPVRVWVEQPIQFNLPRTVTSAP